jgi:hypothetical protein
MRYHDLRPKSYREIGGRLTKNRSNPCGLMPFNLRLPDGRPSAGKFISSRREGLCRWLRCWSSRQRSFDPGYPVRSRVLLGGIMVAIGISSHLVPMGALHFPLTLPICLLSLTGLGIVRALSSRTLGRPRS